MRFWHMQSLIPIHQPINKKQMIFETGTYGLLDTSQISFPFSQRTSRFHIHHGSFTGDRLGARKCNIAVPIFLATSLKVDLGACMRFQIQNDETHDKFAKNEPYTFKFLTHLAFLKTLLLRDLKKKIVSNVPKT